MESPTALLLAGAAWGGTVTSVCCSLRKAVPGETALSPPHCHVTATGIRLRRLSCRREDTLNMVLCFKERVHVGRGELGSKVNPACHGFV